MPDWKCAQAVKSAQVEGSMSALWLPSTGLGLVRTDVVEQAVFSLPQGLLLLTAVLKDVSLCSRAGVQRFDWLQLEFFDKQIWVCFIGGCTAEAQMSFSWLLWEVGRIC